MAKLINGKLELEHEEVALLLCKPPKFVAGQDIVCLGTRGTPTLTRGKIYHSLFGLERGILPGSPFVTVIDDEGKRYSCHAARFYQLEAFNVEA